MPEFTPLHRPPDAPAGSHRWFCVRESRVLVSDQAEFDGPSHFLGVLDDVYCWAEDVPAEAPVPANVFTDLFSLYSRLDELEWAIAGRAVQIVEWARTHRFCGRCGSPTEASLGDRSMKCPACGLLAFPRLAPAIITLVYRTRADGVSEALLARGVNFAMPMYSCIAGFVEPGESMEQAVAREVREEVGVAVRDVRYISSQPWPFPHSLMIGFTAEWDSGDIVIDPVEIADAQWFTVDALPSIPPGISIARKLIDLWLQSKL
jgi:NAD+ diphosphatase